MPEAETLKRARRDKAQGKAPSTQAGEFVREEIHASVGETSRTRGAEGGGAQGGEDTATASPGRRVGLAQASPHYARSSSVSAMRQSRSRETVATASRRPSRR